MAVRSHMRDISAFACLLATVNDVIAWQAIAIYAFLAKRGIK
jgi:hypothetical protein